MVDVNPEIWSNPTLGQAANGEFLDAIEARMNEKRDAEIEGREPRELVRRNNYPGFTESNSIPSYDNGMSFVVTPSGCPDPSPATSTNCE